MFIETWQPSKKLRREERHEKKRIAGRLRYEMMKKDPTKLVAQKKKSANLLNQETERTKKNDIRNTDRKKRYIFCVSFMF